jgi:PIN domain nuclease of toxin-antitoxin system
MSDSNNEVFVSAATAWEIATKYRIGKLDVDPATAADLEGEIARDGFYGLPISFRHGQFAGALIGAHKDPFDRMIIAQSLLENMTLVSNERPFDAYGIQRLW